MSLPLEKYTVLDLTIARAGPTACRLMADWGANVIRIEPPAPPGTDSGGINGARHNPDSQNLHRNKRGMTINLKSPEGHALFMRLAEKADVIIENFRKDVKHRLKVDYESVCAVNPAIVYASISGFGQEGPYSERPGVDQITQGTSGLMSITGEPGRGPMRVGVAISDTSAGMFLGQGILLALLHREHTGEGQWVHTSLLEAMLCKIDFQGARYTMLGQVAEQQGNNHPTIAPMGVFDAADGQINLAASSNKMFEGFCKAMEAPHLVEDERFRNIGGRVKHSDALLQMMNDITSQKPTEELVEKLNAVGCPCGPIYNIGQAFEDPQAQFLKMAKPVSHPTLGEYKLIRSPINLSRFPEPPRFARPGPELGEHTEEILREAGLSSAEIDHLVTTGAI